MNILLSKTTTCLPQTFEQYCMNIMVMIQYHGFSTMGVPWKSTVL